MTWSSDSVHDPAEDQPGPAGAPLAGIRVLDFSHAAAGPYVTMLMADLGADVIKIERPGRGDGSRTMGQPILGELNSDVYAAVNRNKRDLVLDLGTERGVEIARQLAAESDVVVENFRPGVMSRLGLGFADLRTVRRGLVYCSISAFGTSGPLAAQAGNDIIVQSMSGLMGVTGEVGGGPVRVGVAISDFTAGLFALSGTMCGLFARDAHPEGQHIEVAMLDASLALMANLVPRAITRGERIPRMGRQHPQIVPYQAFECSDGEYIMVGAFTRKFWQQLCGALGHPEWEEDDRFRRNVDRQQNRASLIGMLEEIFLTEPRGHWQDLLGKADVPCSPVYEVGDALQSEQAIHNGVVHHIEENGASIDLIASPIHSAQWQTVMPKMPPSLGEDTYEVLEAVLGLSSDAVADLAAQRVVYQREEMD
jgi:crotonobetainyl-CoA:carnitine CoA-transferase CaiB-like acyl-CoA transferase